MRKGISPLIAVIMLIAFTMIVAGILAGWATTFVTQQREELQFCARAQLLIQNANYNATTNNLTVALFKDSQVFGGLRRKVDLRKQYSGFRKKWFRKP